MFSITTFAVAVAAASAASARTFTVKNNCAYTVWPALFTDMGVSTVKPDQPTGWEQAAGESVTFDVPDEWKAGRIWGRSDCDFNSDKPDYLKCLTGGCNGGLLCDGTTGTGVPPATVAEWTLEGDGFQDWFDVSVVDGFNIPAKIDNNVGCGVPSCPVDLNPLCPSELSANYHHADGSAAGCLTACKAGLAPDLQNDPYCCTGTYATGPEACPASGVLYYDLFKDNCPNSYVYAYDEPSGTALWTCDSNLKADYTLTFCP
ncbi:Osmotin thaumatin-like protein [Cylindrobasidium torrendii FP15055 ss-10]|uniref:Osmotin thaumatin-like protein n=1 Tax=Cylindrobasidium torrendii FP15055 ss-10 TaxID=1314674 RepID=A0A0D7BH56_9AGAR|nr:Osmotin thaumatin-like protein [Cylindrobasidium torrendii FP15055 ss-10]